MIPLLLILTAPAFQIVLSVLKIKGRIYMQLSILTCLTFVLGILLSIAAAWFIDFDIESAGATRCGIFSFAFFIGGLMITLVFTPVIAFIGWLIYRKKNRLPVN